MLWHFEVASGIFGYWARQIRSAKTVLLAPGVIVFNVACSASFSRQMALTVRLVNAGDVSSGLIF